MCNFFYLIKTKNMKITKKQREIALLIILIITDLVLWLWSIKIHKGYDKIHLKDTITVEGEHNSANENQTWLTKIADYLYETTINDLDYDFAQAYFEKRYKWELWACSSIRNWNFVGRNYDRYYDENPEIIVHIPASKDRHASINVAVVRTTDEMVQQWLSEEELKILPFMAVDGINDSWVAININVVPTWDLWFTTWTNPEWQNRSAINIVRYVLDKANSVDHAIELLKQLNIYAPMTETFTQELHFMISDSNKTVIVEFVNNEMVVVDENIMTNFYASQEFTPHANGIERYNLLKENYDLWNTQTWMIELMKKVWYTNLYNPDTNPFRYSEYYMNRWEDSYGDLTINSTPEDLAQLIENSNTKFLTRERNWIFWQTVHTSIYDLENKTLTIIPQESDEKFEFVVE